MRGEMGHITSHLFVTGLGCVTAIGRDVEENALFGSREQGAGSKGQGTGNISNSSLHLVPCTLLPVPCSLSLFPCSRTAQLGVMAAGEALRDAGFSFGEGNTRIGLVSSTSTGGMDLTEQYYPAFRKDHSAGRLRYFARHDAADSTECIASHLGITGFRTTVSTACSSAANAIMFGARLVRSGMLDVVVAGGTDALCRFTIDGFASLKILDPLPCRPFDASRAGLNLGEGAGYIVLQNEASLRRRPYCRLAGYANANDAFHQTASSAAGTGAYLAMAGALEKAGLPPSGIDYINAHGTGTPNNDASESAALLRLFGDKVPPFSSTKGFTGHCLGAAGGIEAVYSVLAISRGIIPPNKNFTTPMPETGLVPVTHYSEGNKVRAVLSNSFGFGGNNAALVFQI